VSKLAVPKWPVGEPVNLLPHIRFSHFGGNRISAKEIVSGLQPLSAKLRKRAKKMSKKKTSVVHIDLDQTVQINELPDLKRLAGLAPRVRVLLDEAIAERKKSAGIAPFTSLFFEQSFKFT
jgi:hypothetical protein